MNSEPLQAITVADIKEYEDGGAVCLRGMVDQEWIERLHEAIERNLKDPGPVVFEYAKDKGRFHADMFMWQRNPDFRAFVAEGPCARIAQILMRSTKINLFYDHLFVKEPGTPQPTPWHHDQPYWPVAGRHICSIWLALDPVTRETSGLEYIHGSHNWGRQFRPQAFDGKTERYGTEGGLEPMPDINAERDRHTFLSWDMQPGDVLVHQGLTIHGAGGNASGSQRRRAIATRWTGDDARYAASSHTFRPLDNPDLQNGAIMDSLKFPVVLEGDRRLPLPSPAS